MSLIGHLKKLRHIVEELQLALHLAQHAPDDFVARTLARHVIVRAADFIAHARQLRRPLNQAGYDTGEYHRTKEIYTDYFQEYFRSARDKLGAHIQDFDFGKRIELWNDVELVKLEFFVETAIWIYRLLEAMNIPRFTPYSAPPELQAPELRTVLLTFRASGTSSQWAELASDSLAASRPNTTSALNLTPVHSRAAQLALIRRWLTIEEDVLARVQPFPRLARIVRARIVTDIVSFADCLVTRTVAPGAPQAMDGLDSILQQIGHPSATIANFLKVFAFAVPLRRARRLRDRFGAHLGLNETQTLHKLLQAIDTYDLPAARSLYDHMRRVFQKVCFEVLFLRMYVADGQRIYGVTPNSFSVAPFDARSGGPPPPRMPPRFDYNSEAEYLDYLGKWLGGGEEDKGDARYYFHGAFMQSDAVEQVNEQAEFAGGVRYTTNTFRRAHRFVLEKLITAASDAELIGIFELLLACRGGDPHMLAEVLVRFANSGRRDRDAAICFFLGELADWPHDAVKRFLDHRAQGSQDWHLRFHATLALFKIFVRTEGLTRINAKRTVLSYNNLFGPLLAQLNLYGQLFCAIAFASQFCGQLLFAFTNAFLQEYQALQDRIRTLTAQIFGAALPGDLPAVLDQLLGTDDYVGVCLLLETKLPAAHAMFGRDLLTAAATGWVVPARHDQATRHLALCFLRLHNFPQALYIADGLAARNPDNIPLQILVVQILAETPGAQDHARQHGQTMRSRYKLTAEHQAMLAALDQAIAQRAPSPQDVPANQ
jgi:hypothetical protein